MNRNVWIILITTVIVIIGLIWIFNRGPLPARPVQAAPAVSSNAPTTL